MSGGKKLAGKHVFPVQPARKVGEDISVLFTGYTEVNSNKYHYTLHIHQPC